MRTVVRLVTVLIGSVLLPSVVFAQASITGVVKDSSGAVLPGVTVEAASPALIEKVRTATTDGSGQYRIVDLRPGAYTVTFTLAGFNTVRREGITLSGSFTAAVDAELRVGSLQETVTVTGEAPIVDVQSATRQAVIDHAVADQIPTGRSQFNLAVLVPGINTTGGQDVGGAAGTETNQLTVHGSRGDSQRITQNGISLGTLIGPASMAGAVPNMSALQEMTIDYSAVSADLPTGGVRINIIPREGGNTFKGSIFASYADEHLQGNNLDQDLIDRGLKTASLIRRVDDINPGVGGPIQRDKLWFYTSVRYNVADNYASGIFFNKNVNDPAKFLYEADPTQGQPHNPGTWKDATLRLTWQATQKNKIAASLDYQTRCTCPNQISATTAPESANWRDFPLQRSVQMDWTNPLTNHVLLEVVGINRIERWGFEHLPYANPAMTPVIDQFYNLTYRNTARGANGVAGVNNSINGNFYYRAAVSYITGAHSVKVGFNDGMGYNKNRTYAPTDLPIVYRFNKGVPNQITELAFPFVSKVDVDHDMGLYGQDKWTVKRLTLAYGVRFDHFASSIPEQHADTTFFTPGRNITFPAQDGTSYYDITPKSQASYDVFGNGKTALKVSLNKYLAGLGTGGLQQDVNPLQNLVNATVRSWSDANGNYLPDCNLLIPDLQDNRPSGGDLCGPIQDRNFGQLRPGTTFDPDILKGWGHRDFNWEFSAGVQHEVLPRTSVDVSYFRRSYGNFVITDNLATTAADYTQYSITAPTSNPNLPNAGETIGGLFDVNPSKFGQVSNYRTFAKNYGKQIDRWNGVDVSVRTRLAGGLMLQGGTSTGREVTDNCEVAAKVPEVMSGTPLSFCHQVQSWLTQVKGFVSYNLPKVDVLVSGTFQSIPGPQISANYVVTNAIAAPSLRRPFAGNVSNQTYNIVPPTTMYGERLNQLDLRFGKSIRVASTRLLASVDVYNAFNANPVLTLSNTFTTWLTPQSILTPRFVKFSVQYDF